ncbi:MAG: hypothetical protein ACERIG_06580, partial [Hyphomicrobium sp.]
LELRGLRDDARHVLNQRRHLRSLAQPPHADKIVKANQSPPEIRIFGNAMTTERRMDTERCSPGHESDALL